MKTLVTQTIMMIAAIAWLTLSFSSDTIELEHFRMLNSSIWVVGSLIVGNMK